MDKELRDQSYHAGICCLLTILSIIPFVNPALFAITREYYQEKRKMEERMRVEPSFFEVIGYVDFFKLDLIWSYIGILIGLIVLTIFVWVVFL